MSNMSSKYKYIARNSIALFIGSFASKILVFFLLPLYTSYLTTSEYAVADLINTTSSLLLTILSLSIGDAILRFAMDSQIDKKQILSIGLFISGLGCIIAVGIAVGISLIPSLATYAEFMLLAIALYVFCSMERVLSAFVKGLEKIRLISIVGVISTAIMLVLNVVMLVSFRWGIKGYLLAYIISHFAACIIYFFWGGVYRYLKIQYLDKTIMIKMLNYSLPLIFVQICWQLNASADKYVVAFFSNEATVGLLSAAHKIPSVLTLVTTLFTQAWNLSAIKEDGEQDSQIFYGNVFEIYTSVIIIAGGALIVLSQALSLFLLQGDFYSAWRYIPFYILGFVFNSVAAFLGSFYLAKKKTKSLMGAVALGTGINIALDILLFPWLGLVGTGVATACGYFIIACMRLIRCSKERLFSYKKSKLILSFCVLTVLSVFVTYGTHVSAYGVVGMLFVTLLVVHFRPIVFFLKKILKKG